MNKDTTQALQELHRRVREAQKIMSNDRSTIEDIIEASNRKGDLTRQIEALEKEEAAK